MPFDARMNMYNAFVIPYMYFNYCSTVWGNIGKGISDKFQKLQNRAARNLSFSNYKTRSSVLVDDLGWERLENMRYTQLAMMMYKIHNHLSPSFLRQIFTNTSNEHAHNLRNSRKSPDQELNMRKGAYTIEDLFCGTRFPRKSDTCLHVVHVV